MRILVLGAGVLGCNVAIDLLKAGEDVTLLARGQWYQTIRSSGLRIKEKFSFRTKTDKAYIHRIIDANIECYTSLEKLEHTILPVSDQAYRTPKWRRIMFLFYKFMASCSLGKLVASDHALSAVDEMAALADAMDTLLRRAGTGSAAFDELKSDLIRYQQKC